MKIPNQILLNETPHSAIDGNARVVTSPGTHFDQGYLRGMHERAPVFERPPCNIRDLTGQQNGKITIVGSRTVTV